MLQATPTAESNVHLLDDYAISRIDYRVSRLTRRLRLGSSDAEDLRQDMVVVLLKAAPQFDPTLSRRRTFINRVLDQHYKHVLRYRLSRQRTISPLRVGGGCEPLANDPRYGEPTEQDQLELRMDLETLLQAMPAPLRRVAMLLQTQKPCEVAESLGVHRATVFRAIQKIRALLMDAGYSNADATRATDAMGLQM